MRCDSARDMFKFSSLVIYVLCATYLFGSLFFSSDFKEYAVQKQNNIPVLWREE